MRVAESWGKQREKCDLSRHGGGHWKRTTAGSAKTEITVMDADC